MTIVTILNFHCKDCNTTIGQLVTDGVEKDEDIQCPECKSKNVTYSTLLR